jgi:hypothetical protein
MTRLLAPLLVFAFAVALTDARVRADDPRPPSAAAQAVDLHNAKCPVTGKPVVPGVVSTVNGATVHFCCTGCAAKYAKDPGLYESALRAEPDVAKRLDAARAGRPDGSAPAAPPPDAPPAPPSDAPAAPPPGSPPAPPPSDAPPAEPTAMTSEWSPKAGEFHDAMRILWEDHVVWTRLFVVSAAAGLPDLDAARTRLRKNQDDLGAAVEPFYGKEAAAKLAALLKDHVGIAADLVAASKAKDTAKADAAARKWRANADEIAALLSGANPAWSLDSMKAMLGEHLDVTTAEVTARLNGDWSADVAAFERAREQARHMADMLSDGIRRQFPDRF